MYQSKWIERGALTILLLCMAGCSEDSGGGRADEDTATQSDNVNLDTGWEDDTTFEKDTGLYPDSNNPSNDPYSPKVIFTEEFNDGMMPPGWFTLDLDGKKALPAYIQGWEVFPSGNCIFCAPGCVVSSSAYEVPGRSDDWLITPPITLGDDPYISWVDDKQVFQIAGADFRYEVRISTDKPIVEDFMKNDALSETTASWGGDGPALVHIPEYKNQTVYFALRNVSMNSTDICINYFRVLNGTQYPDEPSGPIDIDEAPSNDPAPSYDFEAKAPWYDCPNEEIPKGATVVTALNREYQYEQRQTVSQLVDFPESGDWKQVAIMLDVRCPESGVCSYEAHSPYTEFEGSHLNLVLNPEADPVDQEHVELLRYFQAPGRGMCVYADVTRLKSLLTGQREIQSYMFTQTSWMSYWGDGWLTNVKFIFYPAQPEDQIEEVTLERITSRQKIFVGNTDPGEDVGSQFDPVSFDVPAGTSKVIAHLTTTGHGGDAVTNNCAIASDVCPLRTDVLINGETHSVNMHRGDCKDSPFLPIYGGYWTTQPNGWCYPSATLGYEIDITDSVVVGASNTVDFDILLEDGTVFVNTNTGDGWVTLTLNLYYYP